MSESLKKVGNYRLLRRIGQGATSQVFQGRKEGQLQKYAIKMMKIKNMSATQRQMIGKEVSIIKGIDHPNIVKLYDTLQTTNHYYLIFEYCQRGDLQKYLKDYYGPLIPPQTVQKIIYCIADAIALLHSRGIAHRDIKLANILLKKDCTIKLADFGFARESGEEAMMKTYCGTPITMAPQILMGRYYDKGCDVWSLGVILYQLSFGKLPFPINEGFPAFVQKVTKEQLQIPNSSSQPPQFIELLNNSLCKDPEKRWPIQKFLANSWVQKGKQIKKSAGDTQCQLPVEKAQSIGETLKRHASKDSTEETYLIEQENGGQIHLIIVGRVTQLLQQEIIKICNRHIEVRQKIKQMIKGNQELEELLEFYDYYFLAAIRNGSVRFKCNGCKEAKLLISKIPELKIPLALASDLPSESKSILTLFSYLKSIALAECPLQSRKQRYYIVMNFLSLIHQFELIIGLFPAPSHSIVEFDLQLMVRNIEEGKRAKEDKGKEANAIVIALECKEKDQKIRQARQSLRSNCLKRIDAIQRQINGY